MPQLTRRTNPASFLPVRTKFTDRAYEDDPPEQPIDYSRKYSETKTTTAKKLVQNDPKEDKFGSMEYTETDLDQPTDYSLRYAEDDSDSDICDKISKQEYVQDTVKTYCTEGTPYETPFVFSNATSMSDLRNVDDKPEINNDMPKTDSKDNKEVITCLSYSVRVRQKIVSDQKPGRKRPMLHRGHIRVGRYETAQVGVQLGHDVSRKAGQLLRRRNSRVFFASEQFWIRTGFVADQSDRCEDRSETRRARNERA